MNSKMSWIIKKSELSKLIAINENASNQKIE